MNAPIRVRLTVLYVLVLAAIIAALTAFVVARLRSDLTSELDRGLRDAAGQIGPAYRAEGPPEFRDTTQTVLPTAAENRRARRSSTRPGASRSARAPR